MSVWAPVEPRPGPARTAGKASEASEAGEAGETPPGAETLASGLLSPPVVYSLPQWFTSGFPVVFSSGLLALLCCFASAHIIFEKSQFTS